VIGDQADTLTANQVERVAQQDLDPGNDGADRGW
jgi:hypothetical protein